MVRFAVCVVLAAAAPVAAQTVDWRRAGGDLFAGRLEETEVVVERADDTAARLAELDQPYQAAIEEAARVHGLDPKLLHALVVTESGYQPGARSPVGAGGLTQLMPDTARELGVVDRFDPAENLRGGADYLAQQIVRFGDVRLALAAYNSGPARVAKLGRVPDIRETRDYVATVVDCYLALSAGRQITNARQCRSRGDVR